jgi:NAD(P)-dependent dehydrogenase (short-subunit alcohol dehydrogenase family)
LAPYVQRPTLAVVTERWGAEAIILDVRNVDQVRDRVDAMVSGGVLPHILINNAGVNRPQPALDVDQDSWDLVHSTNLRGVFFLSQALARHWIPAGVSGSIVNIGSQAGRVAIEDRASYGSSKGGLEQLTRNLAYEWASAGIRVNAVAPTFVRTELTRATLDKPGVADELLSRIPLGRFGEVGDVSSAVAFLAGPLASMITGHTIVIDGGYSIH